MTDRNENIEAEQIHDGRRPPVKPLPAPFEQPPSKHHGMPLAPPPRLEPHRPPQPFAVDPGAIRHCVGKYTHVWMSDGSSFWMYPTFVGRRSITGYRYGRRGWVYFGTDLNNIDSFFCAPY